MFVAHQIVQKINIIGFEITEMRRGWPTVRKENVQIGQVIKSSRHLNAPAGDGDTAQMCGSSYLPVMHSTVCCYGRYNMLIHLLIAMHT